MQPLHHPSIDLEHALVPGSGLGEGVHYHARPGDSFGIGREGPVGGLNLAGMDQRLAVKAEGRTLGTLMG